MQLLIQDMRRNATSTVLMFLLFLGPALDDTYDFSRAQGDRHQGQHRRRGHHHTDPHLLSGRQDLFFIVMSNCFRIFILPLRVPNVLILIEMAIDKSDIKLQFYFILLRL